jgi:hypothetical protein
MQDTERPAGTRGYFQDEGERTSGQTACPVSDCELTDTEAAVYRHLLTDHRKSTIADSVLDGRL